MCKWTLPVGGTDCRRSPKTFPCPFAVPELRDLESAQTGHMPGQMGHDHGTHSRGCPAKILYVYWFLFFPHCREEKKVHDHHRKKIIWRTFLASKKNFPDRWWIQKPYENQESHIYHRNLPLWPPCFRPNKVLHRSRAVCAFLFPETRVPKKRFLGTEFEEGDAMKQRSVKRSAFSLNEGNSVKRFRPFSESLDSKN